MATRLIITLIALLLESYAFIGIAQAQIRRGKLPKPSYEQFLVKVSVNNTPQKQLQCIVLKGRAYATLSKISNLTFDIDHHYGVMNTRFGILRTATSSSIITFKGEGLSTSAQMLLPAIELKGELYVPVGEFYRALESLKLYAVSMSSNSILLRESTQMPESKNDPISHSTSSTHSQNPLQSTTDVAKSIKSSTQPPQKQSEQEHIQPKPKPISVPPARYLLPPDLKRRELDIPEKRDGSLLESGVIDNRSIACMSLNIISSVNRITKIQSRIQGQTTRIIFIAERAFTQKPLAVIENGRIKISFANTVNTDKSLKAIKKLNIKSVTTDYSHGVQSYSITLHRTDRVVSVSTPKPSIAEVIIRPEDESSPLKKEVKKWTMDCIVLDAGHGGKDNGAESITGKNEKDVALGIVLKLRDEIHRRFPSLKVVLTRSTDTFVELDKRGEIANAAGGKLFISIHCNSMPTKPHTANGFETYILSPAKTDNAISVANAENAVVKLEEKSERYQKYDDDQLIIATMAQHSFVTLSEKFAGMVQKSLDATTTMSNRGVNQAGFIVLIGASMPSVLIETGFLSNTKDEKILTTSSGQLSIAKGIATAVGNFIAAYKVLLKE